MQQKKFSVRQSFHRWWMMSAVIGDWWLMIHSFILSLFFRSRACEKHVLLLLIQLAHPFASKKDYHGVRFEFPLKWKTFRFCSNGCTGHESTFMCGERRFRFKFLASCIEFLCTTGETVLNIEKARNPVTLFHKAGDVSSTEQFHAKDEYRMQDLHPEWLWPKTALTYWWYCYEPTGRWDELLPLTLIITQTSIHWLWHWHWHWQ